MSLPKFFKDGRGFCYAATPRLESVPGLTPYDGAVSAQGFAVDGAPAPAPTRKSTRSKPAATRTTAQKEAAQPESVDAALAAQTDLG